MATVENFIVKVSAQGLEKLDQLASKADAAGRKVEMLSGAILGVSFGAFIKGALDAADRIADLSDATGLSIGNIIGFEKALDAAGGKARNAEKIITAFYQSIETANDGSLKARDAFAAVGVSLEMLRNASEQDILSTTLQGLSKMEAGSQRTAIATTLLSKAFRSVDPAAFQRALETGNFQELEATIKANAEMAQKLEVAYKNLQIGALKAIEPILKLFGEQNLTVEAAEKIVKALGIAFAVTFGAKTISSVIEIGAGIAELTKKLIAMDVVLSTATGKWATMLSLATKLAKVGGAIGLLTYSGNLNEGEDAELARIKKLQNALNQLPKAQLDAYFKLNQQDQDRVKKLIESGRTAADAMAALAGGAPKSGGGGGANRRQEMDPRQKAVQEANTRIKQYEEDAARYREGLAAGTLNNIRQLELQAADDIAKATADIRTKQYLSDALKKREIDAKTAEINAKLEFDIAKIREQASENAKGQVLSVQRQTEELQRQFDLESQVLGMSSQQEASKRATLEIEKERIAALDALSKVQGLSNADLETYTKQLNDFFDNKERIKQQQIELQNSFEAGWAKAFKSYMDNATNASKIAENAFSAMTSNMNRALENFVDTGKINFSDLATSIIRDIIKIQLQASAAKLFSAVGTGVGQLFGISARANGGPVNPATPYIVGEQGPELFVPKSAGTIIPNRSLQGSEYTGGQGNTVVNYNIQAVDALSFKQLVARDPSFIYAVTEQGKKAIPSTRR